MIHLVYVNGLGPNYKGDNMYEFIFSDDIKNSSSSSPLSADRSGDDQCFFYHFLYQKTVHQGQLNTFTTHLGKLKIKLKKDQLNKS